jgi:hypothetical protein
LATLALAFLSFRFDRRPTTRLGLGGLPSLLYTRGLFFAPNNGLPSRLCPRHLFGLLNFPSAATCIKVFHGGRRGGRGRCCSSGLRTT